MSIESMMKNNEIKFVGKLNLVLIHYLSLNEKIFSLVDKSLGMNIQSVVILDFNSHHNLIFSLFRKIRIGHPIPDEEYSRETISYSEQRTIRTLDLVRETVPFRKFECIESIDRKYVPMLNLIVIRIIFGSIVCKYLIDSLKQHEQ